MNQINWSIRFTSKNRAFLLRFFLALALPVLAYMGLEWKDFTTWGKIGEVLVSFLSNPYLVVLTVINAMNIVPDPTTHGLGDSHRALKYTVGDFKHDQRCD